MENLEITIDGQEIESTEIEHVENNQLGVVPVGREMSFDERLQLLKMTTNFNSIWDHISNSKSDLKINVVNFVVIPTDQTDYNTGELVTKARVIFVADDGTTWSTTSSAVQSSVELLANIAGDPSTWEHPIQVKFSKGKSRKGMDFVSIEF